MKPANYAPIYAALYPQLADLVRQHGYALAVHGTMARDFDLIAVPWVPDPSEPWRVVDDIVSKFAFRKVGDFETKEHGRKVVTISVKFGECFLDLSFMPTLKRDEVDGDVCPECGSGLGGTLLRDMLPLHKGETILLRCVSETCEYWRTYFAPVEKGFEDAIETFVADQNPIVEVCVQRVFNVDLLDQAIAKLEFECEIKREKNVCLSCDKDGHDCRYTEACGIAFAIKLLRGV